MPSASRRKAKQAKKTKALTTHNNCHSSPAVQLQGLAVSAFHSQKMEGSLNGTLQDAQKVESLREDKEVVVEVSADAADTFIRDEKATQSEEKKRQIESGKDKEEDCFSDAQVKNTQDSDTVDLELKETELATSEDNNEFSSENDGLRESNEVVVETVIKDMTVSEEKNVLSSVVTDELLRREGEEPNEKYGTSLPLTYLASEETVDVETSIPKLGESEKVIQTIIEKSLEPYVYEKTEELSHVQEESSYESAKDESFQSSPNVNHAESPSATVQHKIEVPRTTENPTIVPVTQRQHSSWKSCCGLFEIMTSGDR
ncbi:hypothetical protein RJT34_10972 [Clitoria ternatea]|uniref:Uncharacterized protein n=1 Tax=Clitoria ternatea TaxID=43366 RepID=A0AAN9PK31_CLITE